MEKGNSDLHQSPGRGRISARCQIERTASGACGLGVYPYVGRREADRLMRFRHFASSRLVPSISSAKSAPKAEDGVWKPG